MNMASPYLATAAQDEHLAVLGGNILVHLTGKETGGQAFVSTHTYGPGTGVPTHTHTLEDELFHILDGALEITVGDSTTLASAGASAYLPRGIPHAWRVAGNQAARFMLTVTPSGMEDLFRKLAALPPGPPKPEVMDTLCRRCGIIMA